MTVNKINKMWRTLARNIYLIKILLITVIRHYFPGYRKAINIYKRIKSSEEFIVVTTHGTVRGRTATNIDNGIFYSFQGIPYAKPPLGHLRFKDPEPLEPWTGIRDATHEGNDCVSRHSVLKTLIGSEDCLVLNVYTPGLPNNSNDLLRPVMVWIHGGGFTSGSGSTEAYGPEFLLTQDIVLVSFNYRTGILGFLVLDDPDLGVPGNAGLKDMVMALKWVQDNISRFGGDPNNVTIFGESAGGAACHYLMLSPMGKGLFHKAILQSGCSISGWANGRNYIPELAKVMDLKDYDERSVFKILQEMSAEQLYRTAEKVPDPFLAYVVRPHGPVIERKSEGAFLCEDPIDIMKSGNYNHVPFIVGYTTREGMLGEIIQKPRPFRPITNFEWSIPRFLNIPAGTETSLKLAKEIKEFYYGDEEPSAENKDKYYLLETDNFFFRELIRAVNYHRETTSCPIYLYRMSIETSLNMLKKIYNIKEPGVCHADDLGYLFKNLLTPNYEPGSDEDVAVRRFVDFWTNFAKFGDPNPKLKTSLIDVTWKPVTKTEMNFLDIGKDLTVGVDPEAERVKFWQTILDRYCK